MLGRPLYCGEGSLWGVGLWDPPALLQPFCCCLPPRPGGVTSPGGLWDRLASSLGGEGPPLSLRAQPGAKEAAGGERRWGPTAGRGGSSRSLHGGPLLTPERLQCHRNPAQPWQCAPIGGGRVQPWGLGGQERGASQGLCCLRARPDGTSPPAPTCSTQRPKSEQSVTAPRAQPVLCHGRGPEGPGAAGRGME